jgi:hypothetical protein
VGGVAAVQARTGLVAVERWKVALLAVWLLATLGLLILLFLVMWRTSR